MISSKVQAVHLFVLLYSVGQCSLPHGQITKAIADSTPENDHTKQRRPVFLSMNILGAGWGRGEEPFPEDIMAFPSVQDTRTGSYDPIRAK